MLVAHQGPGRQSGDEERNDLGIDTIVLGQLARSLGELADPEGIELPDRVALRREEAGNISLTAAASFHRDDMGLKFGQSVVEFAPAIRVVGDAEAQIERIDVDVEPAVAAIDADFRGELCHPRIPSLQVRGATLATVRAWKIRSRRQAHPRSAILG